MRGERAGEEFVGAEGGGFREAGCRVEELAEEEAGGHERVGGDSVDARGAGRAFGGLDDELDVAEWIDLFHFCRWGEGCCGGGGVGWRVRDHCGGW